MKKQIVIAVDTGGEMRALHMDEFPLMQFGKVRFERASTIELDEEAQTFFVLPDGEERPLSVASGFKGYEIARAFEIEWLQSCTRAQCAPHGTAGIALAAAARAHVLSEN